MTSKEFIYAYLIRKGDILDKDYQDHVDYHRYHRTDEVDYLELIIKKVRRDTFREVCDDLLTILKMKGK